MPVLYFIRHGETDFNVAQRLQGRSETRLNARGRSQSREIAGVLRDLFERDLHQPSDYAYVSSPLLRARETMELMRAELGLDHGFPCRLIAADRPGVMQTKWVTRLEVL